MTEFVALRPIYVCVFFSLYADISLASLRLHGRIPRWGRGGGAGDPDPSRKSQ